MAYNISIEKKELDGLLNYLLDAPTRSGMYPIVVAILGQVEAQNAKAKAEADPMPRPEND
jgi:hypothetical protein